MSIKYMKHPEINKTLWDKCVSTSPNGLIYGMSWYLDRVCPLWDALVLNNYEAVMPLPWKKKFGVKYIYQPWYTQQLGIFANDTGNISVSYFLTAIPKIFLRYDISFNFMNWPESNKIQKKHNYILPLSADYSSLLKGFSDNTIRNIKKANRVNYPVTQNIGVDEFMNLLILEMVFLRAESQKRIVESLIKFLIDNRHARFVGIKDSNNQLLGAVLLAQFNNRIIYLFSASSLHGKELRVMFKIVDQIVREHSQTAFLLDFEGSMNEGIARFFKSFGSQCEIYYRMEKNFLGIL